MTTSSAPPRSAAHAARNRRGGGAARRSAFPDPWRVCRTCPRDLLDGTIPGQAGGAVRLLRRVWRMDHLYDRIGAGYAERRRPDPRIAAALVEALGPARSVLNVGAGAGSYEPGDRRVVAVEPARTMLRQRPPGAAPAVQATAERLPFADGAFDAAMAALTLHHWPDADRGLAELARVARERVVLLTWLPGAGELWLTRDYFPGILAHDLQVFPGLERLERLLGPLEARAVPIPHDCLDGLLAAHWRRPAAYLEPAVRAAMSSFARLPAPELERGLARLRADLASGAWAARQAALLERDALDAGYRLVIARPRGARAGAR